MFKTASEIRRITQESIAQNKINDQKDIDNAVEFLNNRILQASQAGKSTINVYLEGHFGINLYNGDDAPHILVLRKYRAMIEDMLRSKGFSVVYEKLNMLHSSNVYDGWTITW